MEGNNQNKKPSININDGKKEPVNKQVSAEEQIERLKDIAKNLAARCASLENTWILSRATLLNEVAKNECYDLEFRKQCMEDLKEFLFPKEESK